MLMIKYAIFLFSFQPMSVAVQRANGC